MWSTCRISILCYLQHQRSCACSDNLGLKSPMLVTALGLLTLQIGTQRSFAAEIIRERQLDGFCTDKNYHQYNTGVFLSGVKAYIIGRFFICIKWRQIHSSIIIDRSYKEFIDLRIILPRSFREHIIRANGWGAYFYIMAILIWTFSISAEVSSTHTSTLICAFLM